MDDIDQCKINLSKYYTLRESVNNTINILVNASNAYDDMEASVSDSFIVDNDKPNVYNKISENRKKIYDTSQFLKNTVLPEIDRKIFLLKNKITSSS